MDVEEVRGLGMAMAEAAEAVRDPFARVAVDCRSVLEE